MKWCHDDVIIVCSHSYVKLDSRQPTALKLCRVITFGKFHKIRKFKNHVTRNDLRMMSLPKTMSSDVDVRETSQIIYYLQGFEKSYPKM